MRRRSNFRSDKKLRPVIKKRKSRKSLKKKQKVRWAKTLVKYFD